MTDTIRLFIPPLGYEFKLAADWTFALFHEHRNEGLISAAGLLSTIPNRAVPDFWQMPAQKRARLWERSPWRTEAGLSPGDDDWNDWRAGNVQTPFTLRAGSRLKVERIYIRQGQKDFDSVSFRVSEWPTGADDPLTKAPAKVKSLRFWAKLGDVNRILLTAPR